MVTPGIRDNIKPVIRIHQKSTRQELLLGVVGLGNTPRRYVVVSGTPSILLSSDDYSIDSSMPRQDSLTDSACTPTDSSREMRRMKGGSGRIIAQLSCGLPEVAAVLL